MNPDIRKDEIIAVSIYKFAINSLRILLALVIFNFSCDIVKLTNYVCSSRFLKPEGFITDFLGNHIFPASPPLVFFLASVLLLFSLSELVFVVALLFRKRWGAIGFFIISILWIPVELLLISKFLLVPKLITLLIDILIIGFLFYILRKPNHYFREN